MKFFKFGQAKRVYFVTSLILLVVCVATVWQFLFLNEIPQTPNDDLARHVAAIENFQHAIADGQWIPRLQLEPAQVPDIPVFQFYGFMSGLLSQPYLEMGASPLSALMLAVLTARWIGVICIFQIGRILGGNVWCCLLAAISYLLTPYIISNLYGRVAVTEAIAHGFIPLLFYGVIRFGRRTDVPSVACISFSILALALSHPIFLLYGCLAAAGFLIFTARQQSLPLAGLVFVASILIASFHWFPGFQLRDSFVGNFSAMSPFATAALTSPSGLYGLPLPLTEYGVMDASQLYLTPGILTIPVIALLTLRLRHREPITVGTLSGVTIFTVMSFAILDFWQLVPRFFWAVQFPYRLLAFVALFTAIGICLTLRSLRPVTFVVLVGLLMAQSHKLLLQAPYPTPLRIIQQDASQIYPNFDYMIRPRDSLTAGDGWLIFENRISTSAGGEGQSYLSITGASIFTDGPIDLWLARPSSRDVPTSEKISVGPGAFSGLLSLPSQPGEYTLVSSRYLVPAVSHIGSSDTRRLNISIQAYALSTRGQEISELGWQIPASAVERVRAGGYEREFRVRDGLTGQGAVPLWIELPIAFSPLIEIRQHGITLRTKPTDAGRSAVLSFDVEAPFVARFRVPVFAWFGSMLGAALLAIAILVIRRGRWISSARGVTQ